MTIELHVDEDNHKFVTSSTIAANLKGFSPPQQSSYRFRSIFVVAFLCEI